MYHKHSQKLGFSIRLGTCRRVAGPDSAEFERYFVCSNQGKSSSSSGGNSSLASTSVDDEIVLQSKNCTISRTNCAANVRTKLQKTGEWLVVHHVMEHNHVLTPPQWQHHHRSERRITKEEGDMIQVMTQAKVPPSIQYRFLSASCGGEEFVGHTKKVHYNYVNRLKMRAVEGGDASTLINVLSKRQAEDPGFFYRVMFDEESRLCRLFWRDSMMKEDYLLYRDVFIFDTTHRTNRYNLICGVFVGINNHWSNVMFGCAFLANETTESFEWLFQTFNESMGEDLHPVTIFTDQDLAMSNAIEKIYPTSRHRLCHWHIQQNAISHFGSLKSDRSFRSIFNKCLNKCYNEMEFETTWNQMIKQYGLENDSWFQRLYGLRAKWSTAFSKDFFSAGILSSQRSESTNHAIGFRNSKTTSLTDFYGIFEDTLMRWRSEEERNEFNCLRSTPKQLYPMVGLLEHAAQVYTHNLFRIFEKEFGMAIATKASLVLLMALHLCTASTRRVPPMVPIM
ncbi:hypothetical protein RND81_07G111100 [Saponaria officinalis]|uniref:Protein FAR1-RELATED SEQUENCE n=1 Tax=Saponaria officinalis TaxID=3572 RepID=A0AAW1JM78_SAPOF